LYKDGQQTGPFSEEEIHDALKSGALNESDLAWRNGCRDWSPLKDVIEIEPFQFHPAVTGPTFIDNCGANCTGSVALQLRTGNETPLQASQIESCEHIKIPKAGFFVVILRTIAMCIPIANCLTVKSLSARASDDLLVSIVVLLYFAQLLCTYLLAEQLRRSGKIWSIFSLCSLGFAGGALALLPFRKSKSLPPVFKNPSNSPRAARIFQALNPFKSLPGLYIAPEIPYIKFANAVENCRIPQNECIIAIIDTAMNGSAKSCVVFGRDAVYWKNSWRARQLGARQLSYGKLENRIFTPINKANSRDIFLGDKLYIEVYSEKNTVVDILYAVRDAVAYPASDSAHYSTDAIDISADDPHVHSEPYTDIPAYKESGIAPIAGVAVSALLALITSVPVGLMHGFFSQVNPLIFLDLFISFGAGVAIGGASGLGARWGKLRNSAIILLIMAFGMIAEDCVSFIGADFTNHNDYHGLAAAIMRRSTDGYKVTHLSYLASHMINGRTPSNEPIHISGSAMWVLFIIEFGILLAGGAVGARNAAEAVFCEKCSVWAKEVARTTRNVVPGILEGVLKQEYPVGALKDIRSSRILTLIVKQCVRCKGSIYLTIIEDIENSNVGASGSTARKRSKKTLLLNGIVTRETARKVARSDSF